VEGEDEDDDKKGDLAEGTGEEDAIIYGSSDVGRMARPY
jgi:hypothetical protein